MSRIFLATLCVAIIAVPTLAFCQISPVPPREQTATRDTLSFAGCRVTADSDIVDAMQRSGLSADELRNRLRSAGYQTGIATPWMGSLSDREAQGVAPPTDQQRTEFTLALCNLGILRPIEGAENPDSLTRPSFAGEPRREREPQSRIFGKNLFGRTTSLFDPIAVGPVDPSYRIGVGDRLQLVLTGDVEAAYQTEIRGDGTIIIPQIGQVAVAGLTLDGARAVLRRRAATAYSSIGSGRTNVDLTVARLHSNVVYITGEVERAGSYQVSSLSTVFHALTRAGGPTAKGSFRKIELRRAGTVIKTLDLYDYLLRGDASTDERTEQGDIIFVPLNVRSVEVKGAVRRPAIFELKSNEGFADLIRFAGGVEPTAAVDRIQIDRVLAPRERQPGKERAIIDVRSGGNLDSLATTPINDGDVVTVFSIGDLRRNAVAISGAVFQPGTYQLTSNMTLDSLVRAAHGITPWGITERLKLTRSVPETGRSEIVSLDYRSAKDRDYPLQEYDSVLVLDGRDAFPAGTITVTGAVNQTGTMPFAEGQTLQDVVDLARGFLETAVTVEVARRRKGRDYSDTTSIVTEFQLDPHGKLDPRSASFRLARDDRVFVRASPGFRAQRFVEINGLVKFPGVYAISSNHDHLLDLIERAGGLLPSAYADNFVFLRDGRPVSIALSDALRGDREQNIALENGDKILIGPNSNTVFVTGAVEHPSLVVYRRGRSLRDYVDLAGGVTAAGDLGRARVTYPSGSSVPVRKRFLLPDATPNVLAGSTITVPSKPAGKEGQLAQNLTTFAQIASTLASVAIAYIAIVRR